ncbi:hypothetical protein BGZ76_008425, partial [Entomortierella beljakovae]
MDDDIDQFEEFQTIKDSLADESVLTLPDHIQNLQVDFLKAMGSEKSIRKLQIFCKGRQLQALQDSTELGDCSKIINM